MKEKRTVKMPLRRPTPKTRSKSPRLRARAASANADYDDLEDYEEESEPNMRFSHALFVVLILHVIAVAGVFAFNSIKARQATAAQESGASVSASAASKPGDASVGKPATDAPGTHTVVAGDTLTRIAGRYGTTIEALEKENGITTYSTIRVGQVLQIPGAKTPAIAQTQPPAAKSAPRKPVAAKPTPIQARVIATASKSGPPDASATTAERFLATRQGGSPPSAQSEPARPPATQPQAASVSGDAGGLPADGTYTVVAGDNPYSIARKYGVSYQKLIEVNGIEDPTKVQIGQVLKLPPSGN